MISKRTLRSLHDLTPKLLIHIQKSKTFTIQRLEDEKTFEFPQNIVKVFLCLSPHSSKNVWLENFFFCNNRFTQCLSKKLKGKKMLKFILLSVKNLHKPHVISIFLIFERYVLGIVKLHCDYYRSNILIDWIMHRNTDTLRELEVDPVNLTSLALDKLNLDTYICPKRLSRVGK